MDGSPELLKRPRSHSSFWMPVHSSMHVERGYAVHILEHLFLVGEFPERERILSGLTLEQVSLRPGGATHTIYQELWHVVKYQQSIVEPGSPFDAIAELFPREAPQTEREWQELVGVFMNGARAAVALGQSPERLAQEVSPGFSLADELNCVAIHNAYHLGKIVALRQRIGAWPPAAAADGS